MISDRRLARLSLIVAVVGVIALYFIVQNTEPTNIKISDITEDLIGSHVRISGFIKNKPYWHEDGHLFFTLTDYRNEIKVVMFSREAKKFPELKNLTKNNKIIVLGTIDEYKNELEIVAKVVRKVMN